MNENNTKITTDPASDLSKIFELLDVFFMEHDPLFRAQHPGGIRFINPRSTD